MTDLYVIGNGFDLFHDLPTRYTDFSAHSGSKLVDLEAYFYFDFNDDQMWWNFENKLGDFDGKLFFDDHCFNDKCESWGEAQGVADDISEWAGRLADEIRESFESWIESIDVSKARPVLNIDRRARYLSFNYTSVLQDVYSVPACQVNHIHGSVSGGDSLIFGHGNEIIEEPEMDAFGDSTRTMYTDAENAAKIPLYALKKNVSEIIQENQNYFRSLRDIKNIVVIGHSLNFVDMQYFVELVKYTLEANWLVSYYSKDEENQHRAQLINVGVPGTRIKTCSVTEIGSAI
jgi:hypothetical protein